ncbi:putative FMN-binding domain family protein [Candida parapsilosis]|uniref:Transcriptional regulator n=2 Tax=Candida parapsilosis TaxID=5480 RepID=G8B8X8_CANPC|nr:uncharacterized protein CPAR2_300660 [Candida parapsilosis]KAF6046164.1 putative FMN-binding domain family protein [Candida parapsilosis]KAF6046286.1 putative FMN-binding domain family protein [Candida parapsilosis]KAF6051273.1 putative FMN-binding domain family protein [Candida parapsilosis]KAF6062004.1 putative FMN-binding domain family protein [Candida parapsilosis]KAI5906028.1 hypothetical protein K4G60_g5299 [Candida parapsilosis]
MYIPKKYQEEEWEQVEYLIKRYPLATIVTTTDDNEIVANHIPLFLKIESTGERKLIAHIAKANHQIPSLNSNDKVLVIFQSPNSYITPNYYLSKEETHKVVPTWDFASAHIHGSSKIIDDFDFVRDQLNHLTNQEEGKKDKDSTKWQVNEAPENYLKIMQKAITGLEIQINSFECKYKFEQGAKKPDISGVIKGLSDDGKEEMSKLTIDANARSDERKSGKT